MAILVRIIVEDVVLEAELFDTPCAQGVKDTLPIETFPNVWGDEFYFEIPLKHGLDRTATSNVEIGDIGYWPPGRALALFWPHTHEHRIKACAGKRGEPCRPHYS